MATCYRCQTEGLEWVQEPRTKKWRLYNPDTGEYHNVCTPAPGAEKKKPETAKACPHGILKDRWCDQCYQ